MGINLTSLFLLLICIEKICYTSCFTTIDELNEKLMHWTAKYPNFVSIYKIGESVEEKPIYVLKLGANSSAGVPNVKFVGTIHGNQYEGFEIISTLAEYIINEYVKADMYFKNLLEKVNVHLLPILDQDGFIGYQGSRPRTCHDNLSKNKNKINLNRNFPSKTHGTIITGTIQPETEAVINWMQTHFMISAAIFSGNAVVSYPYASHKIDRTRNNYEDEDNANSKTDDDLEFKLLARVYAKTQNNMHETTDNYRYYCPKPKTSANGIINSAAWNAAIGTMQDYNYDFHGCLEISIYLFCCEQSNYDYWEQNREALFKFIEESQRGVKGIIFKNGIPLAGANVSIVGRDIIHKTTDRGEYWRYLLPGTYYIKVQHENITKVKEFEVPKQTVVDPFDDTYKIMDTVILNIDINEEIDEKIPALNDIKTISDIKYKMPKFIASPPLQHYLHKPKNTGSIIKINCISILICIHVFYIIQ